MTEAEKFFSGKEQPLSSAEHVATGGTAVESQQFSMGMRILGVVLFIVLILLGTYLAKIAGHILFGFIVGAGAFSILRVLWWVRKE